MIAEFQKLDIPSDAEVAWLLKQGATPESMVRPWCIRSAWVRLERGPRFALSAPGEADSQRALIFRCDDRGEPVDLAAWQPRTGGLGLLTGAGFCIGDLDQCFNPATFFMGGALRIHRWPLAWLAAEREGIVVIDASKAHAILRGASAIECEGAALAKALRKWVAPPPFAGKIVSCVAPGSAR